MSKDVDGWQTDAVTAGHSALGLNDGTDGTVRSVGCGRADDVVTGGVTSAGIGRIRRQENNMSTNIDYIEILNSKDFSVTTKALHKAKKDCGDRYPECSVFDELDDLEEDEIEVWKPDHFCWYGEGSGHCLDELVDIVLPAFDGDADLVVHWEGGNGLEGLRLHNHVVTRHKVLVSLGEEE